MAKRLTDEEQNLKRKARRRLIGAIALTVVVVIVLPMVLDSEPRPKGQDIDLRIPDPDKVGEFVVNVDVAELARREMIVASEVVSTATLDTDISAAQADSSKVATGKVKPGEKNPAKSQLAEKPTNVVTEGFVAQVGAYSNGDTAKRELDKLKKLGFKAYTEKAGDTIRVRVGPYADREQAEKERVKLEKHGLKPVVMSTK